MNEATTERKPHKWAKEIKAWADGAEIQCRRRASGGLWGPWSDMDGVQPIWSTSGDAEYRVKPQIIEVVRWAIVTKDTGQFQTSRSTLGEAEFHRNSYGFHAEQLAIVKLTGSYER